MKRCLLCCLSLFLMLSCSSKKEPSPKIKILSQEESKKILQNNKKTVKPKLKKSQKKEFLTLQTEKGKTIKVASKSYKNLEKNLKHKEVKKKESIKNTLDDLQLMKYRKDVIENNKSNTDAVLSEKKNLHITDNLRAIFKPIVNDYSLRNLTFKNSGNLLYLDSIALRYEHGKQRISLEVLTLSEEHINIVKKGQKNFFYKNYKYDNIDLHFSIGYKTKTINGTFNHMGYSWIINGLNINKIEDMLDVIRNINFNLFMELKAKYEQE